MQVQALDLMPALIGAIAGFIMAIALFQVALLRAALLTVAVAAILYTYSHGGVPELTSRAHEILLHLARERSFWVGVLAGKLIASLIIWPLTRRRA